LLSVAAVQERSIWPELTAAAVRFEVADGDVVSANLTASFVKEKSEKFLPGRKKATEPVPFSIP
jgi:hypothetical protein